MSDTVRHLLEVFFTSAVPVLENRASIPLGIIVYGLNPFVVFIIAFLGTMLPVPFILLFFNKMLKWMKTVSTMKFFTDFVEKKIQKNVARFEKQGEIALILFIGIPLPITGAWTGSAISAFLGLNFKKSMFCALLGAAISCIIVTVAAVSLYGPLQWILKLD